jgi:hypothetical protein
MDIKTKYGWQGLYATELLETDWSKIDEKIQVAANGIKVRLHEFSMNHGGTPEEKQSIEDALHGLDCLRKEVGAWRERASSSTQFVQFLAEFTQAIIPCLRVRMSYKPPCHQLQDGRKRHMNWSLHAQF